GLRAMRRRAELLDWLIIVQLDAWPHWNSDFTAHAAPPFAERLRAQAFARFKKTHSAPWLVAALLRARPGDSIVPELLAASDALTPASAAWETARYHAARLRLAGHDPAEKARAIAQLDEAIGRFRERPEFPAHNRFRALRMTVARDF